MFKTDIRLFKMGRSKENKSKNKYAGYIACVKKKVDDDDLEKNGGSPARSKKKKKRYVSFLQNRFKTE